MPGAETWLNGNNQKIIEIAADLITTGKNITVAAICGATMALAENGTLDNIKHTSNDKEVLKMFCKYYRGEKFYENKPAVVEGNLITASGLSPLEFTIEVIKKINVMGNGTINAWYNLYKTNEPQYFFELMNSLEK